MRRNYLVWLSLVLIVVSLGAAFSRVEPDDLKDWRQITIDGFGPYVTREQIESHLGPANRFQNETDLTFSWNSALVLRNTGHTWYLMGFGMEHAGHSLTPIEANQHQLTVEQFLHIFGERNTAYDNDATSIKFFDPQSKIGFEIDFSVVPKTFAHCEWSWPDGSN